jgi:hypothetical protein
VTPDEPAAVQEKKGIPDPKSKAKKEKPAEAVAAKEPEPEAGEVDGLNVQSLWPLGIVAAGGSLFALYKVDPGMKQFFENAVKVCAWSVEEGVFC